MLSAKIIVWRVPDNRYPQKKDPISAIRLNILSARLKY